MTEFSNDIYPLSDRTNPLGHTHNSHDVAYVYQERRIEHETQGSKPKSYAKQHSIYPSGYKIIGLL